MGFSVAFCLLPSVVAFADAKLGTDGVVRVTSADGRIEAARVSFRFPVRSDWKVLAPEGEGLDWLLPPALVFGLCFNIVGTLAILNDWNIFLE